MDILIEIGAICITFSFVYSALRGVIEGGVIIRRRFRIVKREKEPFQFWLSILTAATAVAFLTYALIIPLGSKILQ
jgi:hypothetical protein